MKRIEEQEALNHFGLITKSTNPVISPITQKIGSSTNTNVFGDNGKLYFCNIHGRNLSKTDGDIVSIVGGSLQLFPNYDGTLNEQRVTFEKLDAFYNTPDQSEVVIDGYVCQL